MTNLSIYTDGGARNNPGPAAIGIIFLDENKKIIKTHKKFLGTKTNNQAEYLAVIEALNLADKFSPNKINFFLDSELVCKQINKEYRIKNLELQMLNRKVHELISKLKIKITFKNVPRENEFIQKADELVNECLDSV